MVHVQFLQFVLLGLITATLLTGGVAVTLSVRAVETDGFQYAAYQPQAVEGESLEMTRGIRFAIKEVAAIMLALSMLTIIPAASTSFKSRPAAPGGFSEIHKNGDTPLWMLSAYEREIAGI